MDEAEKHRRIGRLTASGLVVGECCDQLLSEVARNTMSPLYVVNVHPYSQNCCLCGEVVYQGNPLWPILFSPELKTPTAR